MKLGMSQKYLGFPLDYNILNVEKRR